MAIRDRQWLVLSPAMQREVDRRVTPATRGYNRSPVVEKSLRFMYAILRDARRDMKGRLIPLDLIQFDQALLAMGPNDIHGMVFLSPNRAVETVFDGVLKPGLISDAGVNRIADYLELHKSVGLIAILDLIDTWRAEDKRFGDHSICERMMSE